MFAHDQVAERNFVASLPEIPHEVDEDDDAAVKIIQLVKSFGEPLVRIFTCFHHSMTSLIAICTLPSSLFAQTLT